MFCLGLGRGTFLFGANHQLDAVFVKFACKTHHGLQYMDPCQYYCMLLHVHVAVSNLVWLAKAAEWMPGACPSLPATRTRRSEGHAAAESIPNPRT